MHDIPPVCEEFQLVKGDNFYGEFAHISSAKPGGDRRYNAALTETERNSIDNIIVLCPNHHTIIDKKDNGYTVDQLHGIKLKNENLSSDDVEISENALEDAKKVAENGINIATNNNHGTQQINSFSSSGSHPNFTAARDVIIYTTGSVPPVTMMGQQTTGFFQPDSTIFMSLEVEFLKMKDDEEAPFGRRHLCFLLDNKRFALPFEVVAPHLESKERDAAGKYIIAPLLIANLMDLAKLYSAEGVGDTSLLQEIRNLTKDRSLLVVFTTNHKGLRLIPFEALDETAAKCVNPLKFEGGGIAA